MPHVIVKLVPGKTEEQKALLTRQIADSVVTTLGVTEDKVSVSFEEVARQDWATQVYHPDITAHPERLYKKPGYEV